MQENINVVSKTNLEKLGKISHLKVPLLCMFQANNGKTGDCLTSVDLKECLRRNLTEPVACLTTVRKTGRVDVELAFRGF